MTFRAAPVGVLRSVPLDAMSAIYDRRANATHVVAQVVPAILAALADGDCDIAGLAARLATDEIDALDERLDELVATGLVERF